MKDIAILTIGMQNGFLKNLNPKIKEALIRNHQKLYGLCEKKGIKIINVDCGEKGDTIKELTQGRKIKYKKNNFSEQGWSAFTNPKLSKYLQQKEIEKIILTGLFAETCVFATGIHKQNKFAFYNCGELTEFSEIATDKEREKYFNWASDEKNNNFYYPKFKELSEDIKNETLPLSQLNF